MDQNRTSEKSCSICNQRFNSDRELQEHEKRVHPQDKGRQPASIGDPGEPEQGDQKRRRIA